MFLIILFSLDRRHHRCFSPMRVRVALTSFFRLFFGTKVVNTELHKALPALATDVDRLCVEALQVPQKTSSFG